ncbi:MAG: hypothetical protein JRD68_13485 [Deltaproteobacteria bacterium]|nr:hypothetical protein [Deltaproteobacteria bacterium]
MGIAIKSLFSKGTEVSGFKRRKKADPRYEDPAFPGFVDRRFEPHDLDSKYDTRGLLFFREHHQLERKTILTLGVLVMLAALLLCSIGFVSLAKTTGGGRHEIRKTVNPIVAL